jgi:hypothetical protein
MTSPAPDMNPGLRLSSAAPQRGHAVLELVNETIDELVSLDAVYDALTTVLVRYYRSGRLEQGREAG